MGNANYKDEMDQPSTSWAPNYEEYEQVGRHVNEGLNFEFPPPPSYGNGNMYPPIPTHYSTGSRVCAGCNVEITYGQFLTCWNEIWHPQCLRCCACNQPISDYKLTLRGSYPYHSSCYKDYIKCDVCKEDIQTNHTRQCMMHPFFPQKFCPSHMHDGTLMCFSCDRMEPREQGGYIDFNDGRKHCLECMGSAIKDTKECQPLYIDIQKFFEGLHMKLDKKIPLLLVERQELIEVIGRVKDGINDGSGFRGVCLFSEEVTINSISKRPVFETGNRASGIRTKPRKLTQRPCGVTAILILFGLPRLLTGSIIAHEMMHAWLRSLDGCQNLSDEVEEGICQLMAHMWLEAELSSESASSSATKGNIPHSESKLGEFFKNKIEQHASLVYGDGFRAAQQAVHKYGLQQALNHILTTGNFPF